MADRNWLTRGQGANRRFANAEDVREHWPADVPDQTQNPGLFESIFRRLRRQDVNYGLHRRLPVELNDYIADLDSQQHIDSAHAFLQTTRQSGERIARLKNRIVHLIDHEMDIRNGDAAIDLDDGHDGNGHLHELSDVVTQLFNQLPQYTRDVDMIRPDPATGISMLPAIMYFSGDPDNYPNEDDVPWYAHQDALKVIDEFEDNTNQVHDMMNLLTHVFPIVPGNPHIPDNDQAPPLPLFTPQSREIAHNMLALDLGDIPQEWNYVGPTLQPLPEPEPYQDSVQAFYTRLRQHNPRLALWAGQDLQAERRAEREREHAEEDDDDRRVRPRT
jgi:hypothetical protein